MTEEQPQPSEQENKENQLTEQTHQNEQDVQPNEGEPQAEFLTKRPMIDAETELTYVTTLSPENNEIAKKIAKLIALVASPSNRLSPNGVNSVENMAKDLFTEFSKYTDILIQMLLCSIVRMSPQIESLAALFGFYCKRYYQTFEKKLITKVIPEALQDAFKKDHFRVVKLLLRFVSAYVSYKLITPESFVKLLNQLADMISSDKCTPCRGESLSRAIIIACKTAPACIKQEDLEPVYQKIHQFMEMRPNNFIERFSPIKNNSTSFLDILYKSDLLSIFTDAYLDLFSKCEPEKAESIPEIQFEFGEVDRAPFPFVVPQVANEVVAGFCPIIADIADDILVFFGDDANLTADQMLALPMLLNYKTLRPDLRDKNRNDSSDPNSHFIIPLFNTIILTDVLRIPNGYYQPSFHACVFMNMIKMFRNTSNHDIIQTNLSPVILYIVSDISSLDTGCYFRFVRFFSHYLSLFRFSWVWSKWSNFNQLAENDMRLMFLRDVISHCYYLTQPEKIIKEVRDVFSSILPPKPEMKFEYESDERSTKLREALISATTENIDAIDEIYKEIIPMSGDLVALKILITNIFQMGEGVSGKTLSKIEEYSKIIKIYFNEDWKKKALVFSAFEFFNLMPPVLEQLIVYFVSNDFCEASTFLSFFFDKTSNGAKVPQSWEVFNIIMDSLVAKFVTEHNFNEAQKIVKSVFCSAAEFFKTMSQDDYDVVAERFIVGNLKEFGRNHYDIFASIDSEMNELIATGDVNENFKDIITTISSFGSQ